MSLKRRLISQSAIILSVRFFGAGMMFLTQAAIARLWGDALLGDYLIAIALANMLAIAMPLGFQTIGAYFAADYVAKNQGQSLRKFSLHAYGYIFFPGSVILAVATFFVKRWGEIGQRLDEMWLPICILAVGTAIIYINGSLLIGLRRPFAGFFADTIFRPLIIISAFVGTIFLTNSDNKIVTMLWWVALPYLIVAFVHFAVAVRFIHDLPADLPSPSREWRRWWYFVLPWVLFSLISDFFFDMDLLLLANLLEPEQIAVFGVCARIFVLMSFCIAAVYAVLLPDLVNDGVQHDTKAMLDKLNDANLVATGLSIVLLIFVLSAGHIVLSLFGETFMVGVVPLGILCGALVVRAAFGPASLVLSVRNHPYASLPAIAISVISLVVGNFLLVPHFELVGAAISAFLAILFGSIAMWIITLKITQIDISILPSIRRQIRNKLV